MNSKTFQRTPIFFQVYDIDCSKQIKCCNPSLGLVTKVKACKGEGQEGSLGVTSHAPKSVGECEGMNLHMSKMGLHDPFGYLKHKLWPKEGSKVKLIV